MRNNIINVLKQHFESHISKHIMNVDIMLNNPMVHSSLTQTTVLKGAFKDDPATKTEFFDNVKLQQQFAPR